MSRSSHSGFGVLLALSTLWSASAAADWPADGRAACVSSGDQVSPAMGSDGAGGAIMVWRDLRRGSEEDDLYAHHVLASGSMDAAWPSDGILVCNATGAQWHHQIVSDGNGGAILAWMDHRNGGYDVYAQHVLRSGAIDPAWPANGAAVCTAIGDQQVPKLIPDGAGGAIVAWEDARVSPPAGEWDVYAHHLLGNGHLDPTWPPDGRALCTASGNQIALAIVSDGASGAIVAWNDERLPGGIAYRNVYAQRVLVTGVVDPAWPIDGVAACTAIGDQFTPWAVSDDQGGLIITWTDERSGPGNYDVYAQHILGSGETDASWPVDGQALCRASGNQWAAGIVADGSGGAIVAWHDHRGADDFDVYAQRISITGDIAASWPLDGRALCAVGEDQFAGAIVSDGNSGAIVAWRDQRRHTTSPDIYSQRVLADGDVDRPPDGTALCAVTGGQEEPRAVADAAGGAIVAWQDRRGTDYDIYVQRVYGGDVASVPRRAEPAMALTAEPNPARAEIAIHLGLVTPRRVTVGVYDVSGQRVCTLASPRELVSGHHAFAWDGTHEKGSPVSNGLYFIRATAGDITAVRRITILR